MSSGQLGRGGAYGVLQLHVPVRRLEIPVYMNHATGTWAEAHEGLVVQRKLRSGAHDGGVGPCPWLLTSLPQEYQGLKDQLLDNTRKCGAVVAAYLLLVADGQVCAGARS